MYQVKNHIFRRGLAWLFPYSIEGGECDTSTCNANASTGNANASTCNALHENL
ncbi:MAG: hypothetical protein ACYT04_28750 [Nostoc sp.]